MPDTFLSEERLQLLVVLSMSSTCNCNIFFVEDSIVGVLILAILPCSSISPDHMPSHLVLLVLFYVELINDDAPQWNQNMMQTTLDEVWMMVLCSAKQYYIILGVFRMLLQSYVYWLNNG